MCDQTIFAEPNEIQLNWDSLQKEAEEITTIIFQRVGQPLESVQEETSELCETPQSELIDKRVEQTSIMSSKRNSVRLEETV